MLSPFAPSQVPSNHHLDFGEQPTLLGLFLQMLQMEAVPGAARRRGQGLALAMAAVFGAWAGSLDLRSDELAPYLLVVLGGTFLIAAIFPRDAWGSSLLVAGCVPLAHLYASLTATTPVGYAVYLKSSADSAAGANWYWYERVPLESGPTAIFLPARPGRSVIGAPR